MSLTNNKFKSTTIYGILQNKDYDDGSVLADAHIYRNLTVDGNINNVSKTAINYVSNVTSDIQTQINNISSGDYSTTQITVQNIASSGNKQIFFNLLSNSPTPIVASNFMGLAMAYNNSGSFGETNLISYRGGDVTTGGIELSYLNLYNNKIWLARFFRDQITFLKV